MVLQVKQPRELLECAVIHEKANFLQRLGIFSLAVVFIDLAVILVEQGAERFKVSGVVVMGMGNYDGVDVVNPTVGLVKVLDKIVPRVNDDPFSLMIDKIPPTTTTIVLC